MQEFAWVRLTRLCGCNHKQPIIRKGNSVSVAHPGLPGTRYRINAADFDASKCQYRKSWCISQWNTEAEKTCAAESNWQD